MSALFIVRKPGICSTLQDLGRTGYRAYGVPGSGALDPVMLTLANLLVGNAATCASIEMLYSGITIELQSGAAHVAVCGAEATVLRNGDERKLEPWQSTSIASGETLRVGTIRDTAAAYLAVRGSFDVPAVLGSFATHPRASLGGFEGRPLQRGDVLPLNHDRVAGIEQRRLTRVPDLRAPSALRVMLGPHADRFEQESIALLLQSEYVVSPSSDRSGLRLEGPALRHIGGHDAISEGVATGSIQVPGSGKPVILIADHPTVGGYPKIATIISADVPAAGRLRIGSRLRLEAVDEDEASRARRELKALVADFEASIVDVGR